MDYQYIGWVPCISGKLYFNLSECDVINEKGYINENRVRTDLVSKHTERHIVVASEVDWEDVKTNTSEGLWNVLLLANSPLNAIELTGTIYLMPRQVEILDKNFIGYIKNVPSQLNDGADICEIQKDLMTLLDAPVKERQAFKAEFLLKDNGIVYLKSDNCKSEDEYKLLCRQSYYYVKYTFHKDKHHSRSESLTTVHKVTNLSGMGSILVNDIKKSLVVLKRSIYHADYKNLFAAKGILSYTKSLLMSCKVEALISDADYVIEKSYIDNMSESLEIMGRKFESELSARASYDTNVRSLGLFILAALAPFTLIYKETIVKSISKNSTQDNHIVKAIEWFVGSEVHLLSTILFIVIAYYFFQGIFLKYGSPNFALRKFNQVRIKSILIIVDNYRSAKLILNIIYIIFAILILTIIIRLS